MCAVTFVAPKGSVQVGELRYKDTFLYQKDVYIRISTQPITGNNLNESGRVVVLKLRTGFCSWFQRSTWVTPVEVLATIKELEG